MISKIKDEYKYKSYDISKIDIWHLKHLEGYGYYRFTDFTIIINIDHNFGNYINKYKEAIIIGLRDEIINNIILNKSLIL
jgi:hypothetical protein